MNMEQSIYRHVYVALKNSPISTAFLLTLIASAIFYNLPGIDRAFTGLFYEPGRGFPAAKIGMLIDFRNLASNLSVALPITLGLALTLKLIYPSKPCLLSPRMSLYFISLFLIGPALMVNGVLKSFWGRPRPVSVIDFGGPWPFHEAWVIANHGWLNRSFSSGEAATVACLLPLALFVPRQWRWQVATLVGMLVAATSLNRIAFGAHFLSDVTISICLMLIVAAVLRHLFFVSYADALSDPALEVRLTALGRSWARQRAETNVRIGRLLTAVYTKLAGFVLAQGASARAAATWIAGSGVRGRIVRTLAPLSSVTAGSTVRRLSQATPTRS